MTTATETERLRCRRHTAALAVIGVAAVGLLLGVSQAARAQSVATASVAGVVAGDGAVTVTWNEPSGIVDTDSVGYDVRYIDADDTNAAWTVEDDIWAEGPLHYVVGGLTNGITYEIEVRAVVNSVEGDWSTGQEATPADPGDDSASSIAANVTLPIGGDIASATDVDHYRFVVGSTTRLLMYSTGSTDLDAALLDASGSEMEVSEPAAHLSGTNNFVLGWSLSAGTYLLKVEGLDGDTGPYVVNFRTRSGGTSQSDAIPIELNSVTFDVAGPTSQDRHYYRFELQSTTDLLIRSAGSADDTVGTLYDDAGGVITSNDDGDLHPSRAFALRSELDAGTYYLSVRGYDSDVRSAYRLHIDEVDEPGGTVLSASELDYGGAAGGTMSGEDDIDYFKVVVPQDTMVTFAAVSSSFHLDASLLDAGLSEVDASIVQNVSTSRTRPSVTVRQEIDAGTYYLRLRGGRLGTTELYAVAAFETPDFREMRSNCDEPPAAVTAPDPLLGCQWHLHNVAVPGEDINVVEAWETTTGSGVNVAIVDSYFEGFHQDLADNYDAANSHDYLFGLRRQPWFPEYHGTSVAGIVAAVANNRGVRGVAPDARVRGYNLLESSVLRNEADAMARNASSTAVSNNSWGIDGYGGVVRTSRLWELAVESALETGAQGTGTLFVFSAGNGRDDGDYGSLDEYNTFWGVTAACAVDYRGTQTWYSESGPNLWVCAPSADDDNEPAIMTTYDFWSYRDRFSGTSAAAPQVSGVAALVRAANPSLTWRDVKLILAGSARQNDAGNAGWLDGAAKYEDSAADYHFNHAYGFGVVDAGAAVTLAESWTNVPALRTATAEWTGSARSISDLAKVELELDVPGGVQFTEFVEVNIVMDAPKLRSYDIELVSPTGTVSKLVAALRGLDAADTVLRAADGYWRTGSARHLGENASGRWILRLTDREPGFGAAEVQSWSLIAYGHAVTPSPPTIVSVDGETNPLSVTWRAPSEVGSSAITGYDLRYVASGTTDAWTEIVAATSAGTTAYRITGLDGGTDYDVAVRAVNTQGAGDWSSPVRGRFGEAVHAPAFSASETGRRTISENLHSSSAVGAPFVATDADDDDLTYALSGQDSAQFSIDADGQIRTNSRLDYEHRASYSFTVVVVDEQGLTDEVEATVSVTNVNEAFLLSQNRQPDLLGEGKQEYGAPIYFDEPDGDTLTWTLEGDDAHLFRVNETDVYPIFLFIAGAETVVELQFISPPDYESPSDANGDNNYEVTVKATDGEFVASLDYTIAVVDVDEPPEVSGSGTTNADWQWTENDTSDIAQFTAVDPESASVTFRMRGPDSNAFSVVGGGLRFLEPPDFESPADVASDDRFDSTGQDNVYVIEVQVTDGENASKFPMTVTVTNADEPGAVRLESRQPVVSGAVAAALSDPDGGTNDLVWSWHTSTDRNSWSVVSGATSDSYTPVSSDAGTYLRATVTYTDGHGSGKSARMVSADTVRTTAPANSFAAFGVSESGLRSVAENAAVGTAVGLPVGATDGDGDSLTYSLSGADASSFTVVAETGQLRTTVAHDYEDRRRYEVVVSVSDGKDADGNADTAIDDSVAVTVAITDVDEAPTLTVAGISGVSTLSRNSRITRPEERADFNRSLLSGGDRRAAQFTTLDPENRLLRWSLGGDDGHRFRISRSGLLSFRLLPDYEVKWDQNSDNSYEVRVSVSDGVNTTDLDVTITVTNRNERPRVWGPTAVNVEENSRFVAVYDEVDPDREDLILMLTGDDARFFEFHDFDELQFKGDRVPDFENPADLDGDNRYQVTVFVRDRGLFRAERHVTVTVTDVDEPPTITGEQNPQLTEGGVGLVGSYSAADPELVPLVWELHGADAARFELIGDGDLSILSSPDFESPDDADLDASYDLELSVSDGRFTTRFPVTVDVVNEDESGRVELSPRQPQAASRLTATLEDPDGSIAGQSWIWERSDDLADWSVISGAVSAAYTPDGGTHGDAGDVGYWLRATISYSDGHGTGKSAREVTSAAVRAAPLTNEAPAFADNATTRSLVENQPAGDFGSPIAASDLDNDPLTYELVGADTSVFDIDSVTGQLSTLVSLDRESTSSYAFSVRATDPFRESDVIAVTVEVADDPEPPVLSGPAAVNLSEETVRDVGTYGARDPEGASLMWSLTGSDAAVFELVGGVLRFRELPDHENPTDANGDNLYLVTVTVSDGALTTDRNVSVVVVQVDEPPEIEGPFDHEHPENTKEVATYLTRDPEGGSVTLTLLGDESDALVLTDDGRLVFAQAPDFEQPTDASPTNLLEVKLAAFDGTNTTERVVLIRIVDADDRGTVTLSTDEPAVGVGLDALLSDPDGSVSDVQWQWGSSRDGNIWTDIADANRSRYHPSSRDAGLLLRATATYSDQHGSGHVATGAAEEPVSRTTTITTVTTVTGVGTGGSTGGGGGDVDVGVATFVVANGWSAADVGVASVLAARSSDAVVLYTEGGVLSGPVEALLGEALPAEVVIVGGLEAVSHGVRSQVRAVSPDSGVSRVAGAGRAETAAGVARSVLGSPGGAGRVIVVANGWSPSDIGAAAAWAARRGRAVVLYAQRDRLPEASASVLRDYEVSRVVLVGGVAALSGSVADAVVAAAPEASVSRLAGAGRVETAALAARRVLGDPLGAPAGVTLVVANGWSPPDVGVAAALAAATGNAAVAYVGPGVLPGESAALLGEYRVGQVVIVGGRAAVADDVRDAIAAVVSEGTQLRRITGQTRTHTAANAARRVLTAP